MEKIEEEEDGDNGYWKNKWNGNEELEVVCGESKHYKRKWEVKEQSSSSSSREPYLVGSVTTQLFY